MRVFISVDIEGVAGVTHRDQTGKDGPDYEQARVLMTNEANAAIKGAVQAGADEIVVNDSHGSMRNIRIEMLSEEARLISGSPKRLAMMEGITQDFDAAIFIGYHAKSGSQGILNHTYSGKAIGQVKVNDVEYGEFGLNALIAGEYNVPVVFVSGCDFVGKEATGVVDDVVVAQVKKTINQTVSENLHPVKACQQIEEGVCKALKKRKDIKPFKLNTDQYKFEVTFTKTLLADISATLPNVEKMDDISVSFNTENFIDGFLILRAQIMMAGNYI